MRAQKSRYQYTGCFVTPETWRELLEKYPGKHLERMIRNPHITFAYKPAQVHAELFGTRIRFKVIGYGKNSENEGFLVELSPTNPVIDEMIHAITVPHITVSVSADGAPVNTASLEFHPLSAPCEAEGIYGGFIVSESRVDLGNQ